MNKFNWFSGISYLTDEKADPFIDIKFLPTGSIVIIRSKEENLRRDLAIKLLPICRRKELKIFIANDVDLASELQADGIHFAENYLQDGLRKLSKQNDFLLSSTCHDLISLANIPDQIDFIFLSPIFTTSSHPVKKPLGIEILKQAIKISNKPIIALGGVNKNNVKQLRKLDILGVAAIDEVSKIID